MTAHRSPSTARILAIPAAALCAVSLLLAQPDPSLAQDKDSREQAKRHFRAGEQAYESGQYLVSARAFEESYKLLPIPEIAFSTAQAYRLQYFVDKEPRWLERAITLYRAYIDKKPKGGRRDVAITHLAELEPILLRMQAEGASMQGGTMAATQVMISSPVPGAEGVFQGEKGELPLVLDLEPGRYEVEVSAPGYASTRRSFQALEGRFVPVEVNLEALPATVAIATASGAAVTVDGRPEGETPLLRPLAIEHGTHFIAVSKRGHRPWAREVDLERGQELQLEANLYATTKRKVSYVFAGTAALSVLAGTTTALLASKSNAEAKELLKKRESGSLTVPEYNRYNNLRDERNARVVATFALYSFAGLTATIGGLLWYLDNPRIERPPARAPRKAPEEPQDDMMREITVVPAIGPDMTGVSVTGRF